MLPEPMPEAAPVGGIAVPEESGLVPEPLLEPLPDGVVDPDGAVDGMVDGLVDGDVDGEPIGAGVEVSSIFLPQAPRASSAESATTVTVGLKKTEFMRGVPFKEGWRKISPIHQFTETVRHC